MRVGLGTFALFLVGGCTNNTNTDGAVAHDMSAPLVDMSKGDAGPGGGPVSGAQDTHCDAMGDMGAIVQSTDPSSCFPDMFGAPQDGGDMTPDYGDTMYNSSGKDDDCKYRVSFTVTPIFENTPTTFTVVAKSNVDGSAVTGAKIRAEIYLSDTHPAPNSGVMTVENPPGTYTIAPVLFDASGTWTVRFHLFEDCADLFPTSQHGHAAFFLNVP